MSNKSFYIFVFCVCGIASCILILDLIDTRYNSNNLKTATALCSPYQLDHWYVSSGNVNAVCYTVNGGFEVKVNKKQLGE